MKFFRKKSNPESAGMTPPELLKLVESLTAEGNNEDAFDACEDCLKAGVTLVDAHYMAILILRDHPALGIDPDEFSEKYNGPELQKAYAERIQFLQTSGRLADALALARELRMLAPENNEVHIVAGILCLGLGRAEDAIDIFESALEQTPGDIFLRAQYIRALLLSGFDRFDHKVRRRLGLFLKEPSTVNLAFISRLWLTQLTKDRAFMPLLTSAENNDYDSFSKWFGSQKFEFLLNDDYFLDGVRNCVIADIRVEKLLVYLRHTLLDLASTGTPAPAWALPLAVAIAEQCFINEYVFEEMVQEKQQIEVLATAAAKAPIPSLAIAVLAAYRPLHTLPLKERPQDKALRSLLRQQIDEPIEESDIKKKMKTFGKIADEISQKVRAQYEEHPYPRWISFGRFPDETDDMVIDNADRLKKLNILIAGCATGHFPMRVSINYPYASVTGIDISLSSLAYGARKTKEMGIKNIEFLHGDILDVSQLGRKFDIIFSLGVLHHMGDPEKGWRALVDVLNPGGLMKIGLYPELERQHITEGRRFIAENNIPGTLDGIRQMRKIVMERPDGDPIRKIMPFNDFYSTSMMRDLLFHVSEQVFTVPRIERDLDELGLEFIKFSPLMREEIDRYRAMFPDDPEMLNLEHWNDFEHKYPDTFTGLYQFWCRKK